MQIQCQKTYLRLTITAYLTLKESQHLVGPTQLSKKLSSKQSGQGPELYGTNEACLVPEIQQHLVNIC